VEAVGTQIIERLDWDQSTLTHEQQVLGQAAHVWRAPPSDLPTWTSPSLYDGFTSTALSWIEERRIRCRESARPKISWTAARTFARDGQLPLNTHGGQLSHGRTHGMGLMYEAVSQLRGEAADRQVADARVRPWSAVVGYSQPVCSCCGPTRDRAGDDAERSDEEERRR